MRALGGAALAVALLFTLSAGKCEKEPKELIGEVQAKAVAICGFLPVASTVAAILDALATGGQATIVATAANGICAAVKPKVNTLKSEKPTFAGVVIEGEFVE